MKVQSSKVAASIALIAGGSLAVGCLNSRTDNQYTTPTGETADGPSTSSPSKATLTGKSGSCFLRVDENLRIGGAPGLLVVGVDLVDGSVRHAEYATNGGNGPTVGARDDGGERPADGEWSHIGVTLFEDKWEMVSREKMLKLKISGDSFEMDGIPAKGKCAWK